MKTLSQHLKQVFDALEFTSVSHLNALNEKLAHHEFGPIDAAASPQHQRAEASMENIKSVAAPSL